MSNIETLIRQDLLDFAPYRSARSEAQAGKIWLNANESPWATPVEGAGINLNRYPQKPQTLTTLMHDYYGVSPEQLFITRGSDEAIDCLIRLFCQANQDAIITCEPTFAMYQISARLQGAEIIRIPLIEDSFELDTTAIVNAASSKVKLIFLCSPNNPSGNLFSKEAIFTLCDKLKDNSIIVVDEAYIEFSDQRSLAAAIDRYDNLVILRTLSKAFGLAGARVGVLLARAELVQWLNKIIAPYPLSSHSMAVVTQTFLPARLQQVNQQINLIKEARTALIAKLKQCPRVKKVWPTAANFILIKVDDANVIMQQCQQQGIVLRALQQKELANCLRITVGLEEENILLMHALNSVRVCA